MRPERPDRRKAIPRPVEWRPGGPAPWAPFSERDHEAIGLDRVRRAMRASVRSPTSSDNCRHNAPEPGTSGQSGAQSAVLVALFEEAGTARLILTRRAAGLRTHNGEVSFPGGRLRVGEAPEDAAVREASEEIGLDPRSVKFIGRLSDRFTTSSDSTVIPVVGLLSSRPHLVANLDEVERIFDVALADLATTEVFHEERWHVPGRKPRPTDAVVPRTAASTEKPAEPTLDDETFPVWFFDLEHDTLWGTSARILVELLYLVLSV